LTLKSGILLNRLAWPTIIELSYKRSVFYVQVRAGAVENTNAKIGFLCPTSGLYFRLFTAGLTKTIKELPNESGEYQWNIITFSEKNVQIRKQLRKI